LHTCTILQRLGIVLAWGEIRDIMLDKALQQPMQSNFKSASLSPDERDMVFLGFLKLVGTQGIDNVPNMILIGKKLGFKEERIEQLKKLIKIK
jgi:hypothetical protein